MKTALNLLAAAAAAVVAGNARADAITDWNSKTGELIAEAKMGTPPAVRVMALVQTAAYGAVSALGRSEALTDRSAQREGGLINALDARASADAAVAAAHRATLVKVMPAQQASIDAAYQAALQPIADGAAKTAGIAVGEKAAADVLAQRADDNPATPEAYRPHTSAGTYVPTAIPAVPQWPQRKPWLMASAAQFRPGPPPALTSAQWARDYNEVQSLGGRASKQRSAEQTEAARFWDYSLPAVYHGVVRSVASAPGRDIVRNARLFAAVAQSMDDALIAVFEAKYHYNFWRPATAIRNGDIDGHDATQRDASWAPLIDAPMHPEYPSAHASLASAVTAVLRAEVGPGALPALSAFSPTAKAGKGDTRRWTKLEDFVQEVGDARVHAGIHFRSATDTGVAMGQRIGELAAARMLGL